MTIMDYRVLLPQPEEDQFQYALRLEEQGYEEMFMRKALAYHFRMNVEDFPAFFEQFEQARLGHVGLLVRIHPARSDYSLARKIAKNLSISTLRAEQLVAQFRASPAGSPE